MSFNPFHPMEYVVDEESRPRFVFQSRLVSSSVADSSSSQTLDRPTKLHVITSFSISILLLLLVSFSSFSYQSQTLSFLLVWTSFSLLLAPFSPSSLTGGDPRVGLGDPLPPVSSSSTTTTSPLLSRDPDDRIPARRTRSRKPVDNDPIPIRSQSDTNSSSEHHKADQAKSGPKAAVVEEGSTTEWTYDDLEMLKKQISKHPVGEPGRWEKIAEVFNGRHGLESVINVGKSMGERRRPEEREGPFAQFLRLRKPLDGRIDGGGLGEAKEKGSGGRWSSSDDIALLNALKAFPKDVSMRWEKVAAAVPGRSKGECMKRVSELKRDFRSSKASES